MPGDGGDFFDLISGHVPYPLTVQLETTTRCNLRCIMCPKGANGEVMGDLDPGVIERVGGLLDHAWEIRPHGFGEAFLSAELARVIERTAGSHACVSIVTNGTLISEEWARRLVASRVHRLYVSLDAVDPELFRTIRKTKLEKILVNLRRLREIKAEHAAARPHLTLQMVGMNNNAHELPAMVRLAASLGADEVSLVAFTEFDAEPVHEAGLKSLLSVPDVARRQLGEALGLARELGVRLEVAPIYQELMPPVAPPDVAEPSTSPAPAPPSGDARRGRALAARLRRLAGRLHDDPLATSAQLLRRARARARFLAERWSEPADTAAMDERPRVDAAPPHGEPRLAARPKVRCQDPWNAVVINRKGEVNPCCMSQRVMGNVNDASFEQIWDDAPYRRFRRQLLSEEPPEECRGCAKAGWFQPYELEDWIEVGVNDAFGVQLGTGWSDAVNGVRWSRRDAVLRLANSGRRRLRLDLTSWPDHWNALEQSGRVSVNGTEVGAFSVSAPGGETITLDLPPLDAPELLVRIACERENIPDALTGNGDVRRLGIGLKRAALVE